MTTARAVRATYPAKPTIEGAGVRLHRAFGFGSENLFDPFLMLDDFRGDTPADYSAGFPWHPHRGIETITYVIDGEVEHQDSMGNAGIIGSGDVQWMTAGSGIIHSEMPEGDSEGRMGGFQLWANLPASHKMIDPRYCGIDSDEIPEVVTDSALVRVICGTLGQTTGPVTGVVTEPQYLDVAVIANRTWTHPTTLGHTAFAYLFEGSACFGASDEAVCADNGTVVLLTDGESLTVKAGADGARFLLVSGKPLGEPIAWGGPIVMNTREELELAFAEYHAGTFVKHDARER